MLTQLIEALGSLGDLPAPALQLALEPLAQVQDTDDPPQEVARHLGDGRNSLISTTRPSGSQSLTGQGPLIAETERDEAESKLCCRFSSFKNINRFIDLFDCVGFVNVLLQKFKHT